MFGQRVYIDNFPVNHMDEVDYRQFIESILSGDVRKRVLFSNTRVWHFYNQEMPLYLNDAVIFPDGAPLRWLANKLVAGSGRTSCARVPGLRFFRDVCRLDGDRRLRHAFLGTNDSTLASLEKTLQTEYPGINIVATIAPEFGNPEQIITEKIAGALSASCPDIIWVGLGAPKQDEAAWLLSSKFGVDASFAGIGLVFDYVAGNVPIPPDWVNKFGLEWAYRVFVQPKRTINFVGPFIAMLRLLIWRLIIRRPN